MIILANNYTQFERGKQPRQSKLLLKNLELGNIAIPDEENGTARLCSKHAHKNAKSTIIEDREQPSHLKNIPRVKERNQLPPRPNVRYQIGKNDSEISSNDIIKRQSSVLQKMRDFSHKNESTGMMHSRPSKMLLNKSPKSLMTLREVKVFFN